MTAQTLFWRMAADKAYHRWYQAVLIWAECMTEPAYQQVYRTLKLSSYCEQRYWQTFLREGRKEHAG